MAGKRSPEGLVPTTTDWLRAVELVEARSQGDAERMADLISDAMDSTPPRVIALLQAVLNISPGDPARISELRRRIEAEVFADLLGRLD